MSASSRPVLPSTQPVIRCYLDFDGTLTSQSGSKTIRSPLYRSLYTGFDYQSGDFKENIVEVLNDGFAKNNEAKEKLAPSPEAIRFLQSLLTENAEIFIISKNREEYIKAILEVAGLKKEDIARIMVKDTRALSALASAKSESGRPPKYLMVAECEAKATTEAKCVIVCDDDESDFRSMVEAVRLSKYTPVEVFSRCPPGEYNWNAISQNIPASARRASPSPSAQPQKVDGQAAASSPLSKYGQFYTTLQTQLGLYEKEVGRRCHAAAAQQTFSMGLIKQQIKLCQDGEKSIDEASKLKNMEQLVKSVKEQMDITNVHHKTTPDWLTLFPSSPLGRAYQTALNMLDKELLAEVLKKKHDDVPSSSPGNWR
jgi:hypothetical protein